jgi:hypothetical protein
MCFSICVFPQRTGLNYARPMPSPDPQPSPERRTGPRADVLPAAGVGVIMGFLAEQEGSGIGVAAVVGVVGCGVVLGLLALKRIFHGG